MSRRPARRRRRRRQASGDPMTRAAIILNPATADVSALRKAVEKTLAAAGGDGRLTE